MSGGRRSVRSHMNKRGINLGCGKVILPCQRPAHHRMIPEWLYTDSTIAWDNADRNALPGVNLVIDLFDYPWRANDGALLPDNAYDYAIASHIIEHIPHHIVCNGEFVAHHPIWQDGWFAWFSELYRIMKPGGEVWLIAPFAWSNSGVSDPTHTRYITLATFGYLKSPEGDNSPFEYRQQGHWEFDFEHDFWYSPHEDLAREINLKMRQLFDDDAQLDDALFQRAVNRASLSRLNVIVELCVHMRAVK